MESGRTVCRSAGTAADQACAKIRFLHSRWQRFKSSFLLSTFYVSRKNLIAGHHAGGHVVANMTMKEPNSGIVWDHINRFHLRGRKSNHIGVMAVKVH